MLPHERSLVKELGEDFAIVGVNSDPIDVLKKLVKEGTCTWRNFTDRQDGWKFSKKWGVRGGPTLYLLDQKGVIRAKNLRGAEMEKKIRDLIAEGTVEKKDLKVAQ